MALPTPVGVHSDRGRRPANQDAALVHHYPNGQELIAVADGMGGHAAGEIASQRALEVLRESVEQGLTLEHAIVAANDAILREAADNPGRHGMGTTLVALLREGVSYSIANVGDSRAYRIDGRGIQQITADHTFSAEGLREGRLTAEEAERSPWRRALTRAVGTEPELGVDVFGPFPTKPAHAIVLCTDGLHTVVPEESIGRILRDSAEANEATRLLLRAALDAGSDDNVTVAVVAFGAPPFPGARTPTAAAPEMSAPGKAAEPDRAPPRPRVSSAAASPPPPSSPPRLSWRELLPGEGTLFVIASLLLVIWIVWRWISL